MSYHKQAKHNEQLYISCTQGCVRLACFLTDVICCLFNEEMSGSNGLWQHSNI